MIQSANDNRKHRAELIKEMRAYQREMDITISREARALLKERFNYPIFLYEAEHVGITATGETDFNELYPNDNTPQDVDEPALSLYHQFLSRPKALLSVGSDR